MQRILRLVLCLAAAAALAGLAACGGDEDKVSSETSVNELLDKTFSGSKDVKSGRIDLALKVNVQGAGSGISGPINIKLSGPFESTGDKSLPRFDLDLAFEGAGQNIKAGATSTGDKGFVNFNGQEYAVSDEVFKQFKQGFEQAAKQGSGKNDNPSLKTLGLDPRAWLTNPKNAGEAKVGDADTIKIAGGVDVSKLLDDINTALGKASSLGIQGAAQIPTKLTEEQKQQLQKAVENLTVELYTGKDDSILRRLVIALAVKDPEGGAGKADLSLDLQMLDLNEGQEIEEPKNTKPFDELVGNLSGLLGGGALGGAGGGSSGSGGGSSGSGSSGSSDASAEKLKEYTDCVEGAGNDLAKAQKCAELLAP